MLDHPHSQLVRICSFSWCVQVQKSSHLICVYNMLKYTFTHNTYMRNWDIDAIYVWFIVGEKLQFWWDLWRFPTDPVVPAAPTCPSWLGPYTPGDSCGGMVTSWGRWSSGQTPRGSGHPQGRQRYRQRRQGRPAKRYGAGSITNCNLPAANGMIVILCATDCVNCFCNLSSMHSPPILHPPQESE